MLASFALGVVALGAFCAVERRSAHPMLPLGLFRRRGFSVVNGVAVLMSFGMFGSIFFLAQFLQTVQHYSPLAAGIRTLPWTGMPVVVAPLAGALVGRLGGRALIATGLALQAFGLGWIAVVLTPATPYAGLHPRLRPLGHRDGALLRPGRFGRPRRGARAAEGVASGTNNALRELGGVLGISVLGAVFASFGSYASGATFVAGLMPALRVGVGVVAAGALLAHLLPGRRRLDPLAAVAALEAA